MTDRIGMYESQWRLTKTWFWGCGLLFALMLGLSIDGKFGGQVARAWGLFLPTFIPTLSLIIGAMVAQVRHPTRTATVAKSIVSFSIWLSVAYLVVVAGSILFQPFSQMPPIAFMETSSIWIVPFQALVAAMLGAFFVHNEAGSGH